MILLLLWLAAGSAPRNCTAVEHDHILGADLRQALPAFAAVAADADFGPAPIPGNVRVFRVRELKRIAAERQLPDEISDDVCFAWSTKPLASDALLDAMKRSLAPRAVKIEILDQSSWPVPKGEISLPRSSVTLSSGGVALWRGYINYAAQRRFDIWVRARILIRENHLVTTDKITAGQALTPAQFKVDPYDGPLTREEPFTSTDQVIGQVAKFDIASGTLLTRQLLQAPHDVERGETLTVLSETGRARVEAECIAEESGQAGDVIAVHNARTGRRLRALVQGKARAVLVSTDALGLMAEAQNR